MKEVLLTPEGYEKLTQELELLRTEKRREVADRIRVAREFGEIAENAEYDDAKNEQAMLEHKIAQLEERLLNARVIDVDDVDTSVVSVGSVVRLRDVDAKETVEVPHRRLRRGQPGRVQALERVARRPCHPRPQEGRDGRGADAARQQDQVQDHGDQGSLTPRRAVTGFSRSPGVPAHDASVPDSIARKALPRPGRDRRRSGTSASRSRRARPAETTRRIAGRAMARRDMGKLVFLDVVDRSGRIQVICEAAKTGEIDVLLGDVVGVEGHPGRARRGEPSLLAESLEVLSRNTQSLPDTFHGLTDVELRYRKRYLDLLVNEETRADFILRSRIVAAVRAFLDGDGFVEVETPVLQPLYGGAFARPFVTHHNELERDLYLRIATELYLKRLIVGGLERVYELGKDFRNEGVSFKHNPEFTMLEWYEAYADYRDTMVRIETLVETVARQVLGTTEVQFRGHELELKAPWRRIRFTEALEAKELWTRDEVELRAWLDRAWRRHRGRSGLGPARSTRPSATSSSPS